MSCKHKCKCKKQPVLVLARSGDNNYQEFLDALTSEIKELNTFEFMDINLDTSGWVDLVQKRLKCMCKKYGCKPDLVSAIFNYTAEFQLANSAWWFRKIYSTAFYSQQLEQMYVRDQFKRFRIEVDKEIYAPDMVWNGNKGLSYVLKAKEASEAKGSTGERYADPLYNNSFMARQNGSTIIDEIGEPDETLVTEYDREIDFAKYDQTTVSDQFVDQILAGRAQCWFPTLEALNEIEIIQGAERIRAFAGNGKYSGSSMYVKNILFVNGKGYVLDSANTLVNSRFQIAARSFMLSL
jgi:hypothetical protein